VRDELSRLFRRGAEEGFRLTVAGTKLALEQAEKAGFDVSVVRSLVGGEEDAGSPARTKADSGPPLDGLYEGVVRVEVGPLASFAQLVELEDAAGEIGAAGEIKVERFSRGRATLAVDLTAPTDLLHELELHAPFELTVRRTTSDRVVLDVPADSAA
jgi:hypothetical protein